MKNILAPVDGSDAACRAARFAAELARDTGATLTLMYVLDAPSVVAMGLRALTKEDMEKTRDAVSKGSFDAATRAIGTAVSTAEHAVAIGDPATEIVAEAKKRGVDVIVMGTRGQSPVKELILGSVADRVLHRASCPVTVVR